MTGKSAEVDDARSEREESIDAPHAMVVAADASLKAASAAAPLQALELRCLAATRFLLAGRVDQARTVVADVLKELGMPLASDAWIARVGAFWQRLRATVRGFVFRQREPSAIDPALFARLDALLACATCLTWLDRVAAVEYSSRHTRLALDVGEPARIAGALAMEAVLVEASSPQSRRANALLERGAALARRSGDAPTLARVECCRVRLLFSRGEPGVLKIAQRAIDALRDLDLPTSVNAVLVRDALMHELILRGELRQASELARANSAEAEQRGDALTLVTLATGIPHTAWLVQGGADEGERRLQRARELWATAAFDRTRFDALCAEIGLAFYRAAPERAWACLERERVALEASRLLRSPRERSVHALRRGAAAAWLARGPHEGTFDRGALLEIAERDALALERSAPIELEASHLALRAALAFARGEPDAAAMHLRAIIEHGDERPAAMFAATARRRLGQLLGDDAGASLHAAGEAALRAQAVVDPEGMTHHLLPGCHV